MATPCPVLGGLLDTLYLKLDKKLEICTSKEIPGNVMALASGEAYDWEEDALREALVAQCDDLLAELVEEKAIEDEARKEEEAKEEAEKVENLKKYAEEKKRKEQDQKKKEEEKQRKKEEKQSKAAADKTA